MILKEGDVISVDCGTILNGFVGDSAYTFCVGEVAPEVKKLLKATKDSLYLGIQCAVEGHRLGDISLSLIHIWPMIRRRLTIASRLWIILLRLNSNAD